MLPPLRNSETVQLQDPKVENKETRPPPRYNEGTLIEAMQNAGRFVDDEVLRDRLKEAKGIGTPATRAEIIGGLKKQGFLIAQGKNIVPTETGLSLFGVFKQADPALVDPGVTAQLECLLHDVVVGKQEMVGAINAVCDVVERPISKLKEGATAGDLLCLAAQGAMAQERRNNHDGGANDMTNVTSDIAHWYGMNEPEDQQGKDDLTQSVETVATVGDLGCFSSPAGATTSSDWLVTRQRHAFCGMSGKARCPTNQS